VLDGSSVTVAPLFHSSLYFNEEDFSEKARCSREKIDSTLMTNLRSMTLFHRSLTRGTPLNPTDISTARVVSPFL
jgi:hypothetical protein